jgi:hypothetical protein
MIIPLQFYAPCLAGIFLEACKTARRFWHAGELPQPRLARLDGGRFYDMDGYKRLVKQIV